MLQTHINISIEVLRSEKYGWWSIHRSVFNHIKILWCMYPSKTSMEKLPTGGQKSISDTWRKGNEWCLGTNDIVEKSWNGHVLTMERSLSIKKLRKIAAEEGIIIETSAPYSPSQNGVAERFNRTLLELARAMLLSKDLSIFSWDEAVAHAAYLQNQAPTWALNMKTPYKAWHESKPNVSHLWEFRSDVWVLDESKSRLKLTLVGFMDGSKSI